MSHATLMEISHATQAFPERESCKKQGVFPILEGKCHAYVLGSSYSYENAMTQIVPIHIRMLLTDWTCLWMNQCLRAELLPKMPGSIVDFVRTRTSFSGKALQKIGLPIFGQAFIIIFLFLFFAQRIKWRSLKSIQSWSKETHIHQKRPIYIKRDPYTSKETHRCQKRHPYTTLMNEWTTSNCPVFWGEISGRFFKSSKIKTGHFEGAYKQS